MKTKSSRRRVSVVAIAFSALMAYTSFVVAAASVSPTDEIARAVMASGSPSVEKASQTAFINGFSTVLVRVKEKRVSAYVTAAVKLRPDLAPRIVATALTTTRPRGLQEVDEKQFPCDWVNGIVDAGIAATPKARDAIVKAAIAAVPEAQDCITAVPGEGPAEGPRTRNAGNINGSPIGTINPANIGRQRPVASQAGP